MQLEILSRKIMNKLVKDNVPFSKLNTEFLNAVNGVIQLTGRELELMAEFMDLDRNYVEDGKKHKNVANRQNRKHIIQKLGITKDNLSRYIKAFIRKGVLVKGPAEDELKVNKALLPIIIGDRVQITLILKLIDDDGDVTATGQYNDMERI